MAGVKYRNLREAVYRKRTEAGKPESGLTKYAHHLIGCGYEMTVWITEEPRR